MTRRNTIFAATAAAAVVLGANLLLLGWTPAGLGAAARNTARFSGIIFALALASRSPRFPRLHLERWPLFFAFIAAHGVHFLAVAAVVAFDVTGPLHQMTPKVMMTLAGGFGLVLATALTAGSATAPFQSRAHTFFFYVVAASFAIAFGGRAQHAPLSAVAFVLLLAALVVRMLPVRQPATSAAAQG